MLGDRVAVNFLTPVPNGAHYSRTPYSFTPKVGHKLTSNYYVDMGQGLLECLAEIHEAQETAHAHPVSDHVELRH
jgi:UDP-glucose 4-epimerase